MFSFSFSQTEDFEPYFTGRKRLLPRPSDLSFYNWETQTATSNPTPNYQVCIPSCFVLSVILCHWSDFPDTVEPPCATTFQNTKISLVKALQLEPLVNNDLL